jgi:hypothetical protein
LKGRKALAAFLLAGLDRKRFTISFIFRLIFLSFNYFPAIFFLARKVNLS